MYDAVNRLAAPLLPEDLLLQATKIVTHTRTTTITSPTRRTLPSQLRNAIDETDRVNRANRHTRAAHNTPIRPNNLHKEVAEHLWLGGQEVITKYSPHPFNKFLPKLTINRHCL
jgi:hypothetical protein